MGPTTQPNTEEPLAESDPLAGTGYTAVRRLGVGGMGEVFEARHMGLGKLVVVKLIHLAIADDPKFADRLRVEAQALASVSSPHLVSVTDIGRTPDGRAFFVMERLQGVTFRHALAERGPIHPREAITWTIQVLDGLEVANRAGIIHRDIKLDNVFLCDPVAGQAPIVKVLDFGVAKVVQSTDASFPAPKYATEEGSLVGSPRYVSPEQVRQGAVDARTDVYGVGMLLYQLLVGHDPFSHYRNVPELLHAHLVEIPRAPSAVVPRQHAPYCLPELDHVILKALAKNPADRHQSAEEFAYYLRHILARLPEPTSPIPGGNGTSIIPRTAPVHATGHGTAIIPLPSLAGAANDHRPIEEAPADLHYGEEVPPVANGFDNVPGHTQPMWTPPSAGASPRGLFLTVMVGTAVVFAAVLLALLRMIGVLG